MNPANHRSLSKRPVNLLLSEGNVRQAMEFTDNLSATAALDELFSRAWN